MEIVSSAPSQPVVPLVELSSDDEIEKPHESDDDNEEESGPFEQTETKPLKLPSGVVIKVEKDHWRLEEERRARRIARRTAREAKEKEMTDAIAASQAEVAEMRRRQAETDRKQQALERQMAELMARMNPQARSSEASPSAIPATVTPRRFHHFVRSASSVFDIRGGASQLRRGRAGKPYWIRGGACSGGTIRSSHGRGRYS